MKVVVKLFAGLRERAGTGEIWLELTDGATVGDALKEAPKATSAKWEPPSSAMLALNNAYVGPDHPMKEGDELALIPPVSGG